MKTAVNTAVLKSKLSNKRKKLVFVGYQGHRNYRSYDPETNNISIAIHVRFDKNMFYNGHTSIPVECDCNQ